MVSGTPGTLIGTWFPREIAGASVCVEGVQLGAGECSGLWEGAWSSQLHASCKWRSSAPAGRICCRLASSKPPDPAAHVCGPSAGPCWVIKMKALELMSRPWGLMTRSRGRRCVLEFLSQGTQEGPCLSQESGTVPFYTACWCYQRDMLTEAGDLGKRSGLPTPGQTEIRGMFRAAWGSEPLPLAVCLPVAAGRPENPGPQGFPVMGL